MKIINTVMKKLSLAVINVISYFFLYVISLLIASPITCIVYAVINILHKPDFLCDKFIILWMFIGLLIFIKTATDMTIKEMKMLKDD